LKTSIYIQIVIRWASIHRLSICIIDLPTTAKYYKISCESIIILDAKVTHFACTTTSSIAFLSNIP
jgi:hypothetical protein